MCQDKTAQMPPDQDAVRLNAMYAPQVHHPVIQRQVALLPDPALDPTRHPRQLAVPAAIALGLGIKRSGRALEQHHIVDKFDRNPRPRRRRPVRVTFLNKSNDALTTFNRKWLTHACPPKSASARRDHKSNRLGLQTRNARKTL